MSKITLNDIANLQNEATVVSTLAANNDAIETAIEDTLSRSGTVPNQMNSSLDMNANRILNLPTPLSSDEPVRLRDLEGVSSGGGGSGSTDTGDVVQVSTLIEARTTTITIFTMTVITQGYRSAGDGGGATYTRAATATSIPIGGFQSADGSYWALKQGTGNIKAFGAYGDGTLHAITADDITANPQWMGPYTDTGVSTYAAGLDSWDSVAAQELHYWALASNSTPGVSRTFVWNQNGSLTSNKKMYVPVGTYIINRRVFGAGTGFDIEFQSRKTTTWQWRGTLTFKADTHTNTTLDNISTSMGMFEVGMFVKGPYIQPGTKITAISATSITLSKATTATVSQTQMIAFQPMLLWNSGSYFTAKNVTLTIGAGYILPRANPNDTGDIADDNNTSFTGLWVIDHSGTSPVGLSPQNSSIDYMFLDGGQRAAVGLCISPSGGGAQGSEFVIQHPWVGNFTRSGVQICGSNAISDVIYRGDFQFCYRDAITVLGGSVLVYGTTMENFYNNWNATPWQGALANQGADINLNGNGGQYSDITAVRSEGTVLCRSTGDSAVVRNCITLNVDLIDAFRSYPVDLGTTVKPSANNTKKRAFICVDTGGLNTWRLLDGSTVASNTVNDSSASYTVDQWVGKSLSYRFGSNGFTSHFTSGITGNTATSITCTGLSAVGAVAAGTTYYTISGITGASNPSWDSVATGGSTDTFGFGNGQGFTFTKGSTTVYAGSSFNGSVGDYIVIPYANELGADVDVYTGYPRVKYPYIARVTAITAGGPQAYILTMSMAPGRSGSQTPGYWGTPVTDGDMKWINLDFDAITKLKVIEDSSINAGRARGVQSYRNTIFGQTDWYRGIGDIRSSINQGAKVSTGWEASVFTEPLDATQSTLDLTNYMKGGTVSQVTPTKDMTLNAPTPWSGLAQTWTLQVKTSGTTSYNLTFGTNFVSSGALSTGITSGAALSITFVSDGTNWVEVRRYPLPVQTTSVYSAKTADFTATVVAPFSIYDVTANNVTATIPTAVGNSGKVIVIKKSGTGTTVSFTMTSSQTIDGSTSPSPIIIDGTSLSLCSDGSNWKII